MSKPLLYYCNSRVDKPIFRQIEDLTEKMPQQEKLELALVALNLLVQLGSNYPLTNSEIEKFQLVNKLSAQGQMDLIIALVQSVRMP